MIRNMQGTPKRPDPNMAGEDIPIRIVLKAEDPDAEEPEMRKARVDKYSRGVYLKSEEFVRYGYTAGCDACKRTMTGMKGARNHTKLCRDRIENC